MDEASRRRFRYAWRDVVVDYSQRSLTDPSDKFSALEGIVQEFKTQTGDDFLAGIWRSDIVGGLSWYQDAANKDYMLMRLNDQRTCPSWSWAKVDGPVVFSVAENITARVEKAEITKNEITGDNPMSANLIVEGEITLKAPVSRLGTLELLENFKWLDPGSTPLVFSNYIFIDGGLTNPEFAVGILDGQPTVSCPDEVKFVELSRGKNEGGQNLAAESRGLIVVPVDGRPRTYQRIGFFAAALE